MKTVAIFLVLSYITLCLLLFLFQKSFLYYPQRTSTKVNLPQVSFQSEDTLLKGWVINPQASAAIIYYGGNAESIEYNDDLFSHLFKEYAVYLLPYRGYGDNPGSPSERVLYQDALNIYDQISQKHTEVNLVGRSLGTGVATYVADNREIKRLVLITPYDSIEAVAQRHYSLFPVSWLLTEKYLSIERAPRLQVRTLLLIAAQDKVIPPQHSENLAGAIRKNYLNKRVIQPASHNDITLYPEFNEYITDFFANSY